MSPPRESPFVGLVPFRPEDAELFFGRERDIRLIVAKLYASPLTLVYGPTGVGKTSVLHAGVLPRLEETPGVIPIPFSSWHGRDEARRRLFAKVAEFGDPNDRGEETLQDLLDAAVDHKRASVMLILDQFEEYFLYHPRGDALDEDLAGAMRRPDRAVSVLVSMREDGLGSLDRFEAMVPQLFDNYLRIEHLDREGATAAIEEPLKRFRTPDGRNVRAGRGLTKAVLEDVREVREQSLPPHQRETAEERYEAAHLQLVMQRLWRDRAPGADELKPAALKRLKGVKGILRAQLREVLDRMPKAERHDASTLFEYLVTPSGAKLAYTLKDLGHYAHLDRARIQAVLDGLTAHPWLLRAIPSPDDKPEHTRYELVHDLLAELVSEWRIEYLATLSQSERLEQQGTTFTALVKAYGEREAERVRTGTVRPETEASYRAHVGAFENRFGKIERNFWSSGGRSVALTRDESGRLVLHRVLGALARDATAEPLLAEIDTLLGSTREQLGRRDADFVANRSYELLERLLGLLDGDTTTPAAVDHVRPELDELRAWVEQARVRAAHQSYMAGSVVAALLIALVCAGVAVASWVVDDQPIPEELAGLVLVGVGAGALGGMLSVLARITAEKAPIPEFGYPMRQLRVLGAVRSVFGAGFGLGAALIVGEGDDVRLAILALIAGVGERLLPDFTIESAEEPPARAPKGS